MIPATDAAGVETCAVCHGPGGVADVAKVHNVIVPSAPWRGASLASGVVYVCDEMAVATRNGLRSTRVCESATSARLAVLIAAAMIVACAPGPAAAATPPASAGAPPAPAYSRKGADTCLGCHNDAARLGIFRTKHGRPTIPGTLSLTEACSARPATALVMRTPRRGESSPLASSTSAIRASAASPCRTPSVSPAIKRTRHTCGAPARTRRLGWPAPTATACIRPSIRCARRRPRRTCAPAATNRSAPISSSLPSSAARRQDGLHIVPFAARLERAEQLVRKPSPRPARCAMRSIAGHSSGSISRWARTVTTATSHTARCSRRCSRSARRSSASNATRGRVTRPRQ